MCHALWVLLGYGTLMLLAKWLRDHQRTLCMEGWQQVLRTLWQVASQMLLKSHIWWRARTNQDQSVGFAIGPVSQPLCLSPVEFHFHFSLFFFSPATALCLHIDLCLLCYPSFAFPSVVAVSPLPASCWEVIKPCCECLSIGADACWIILGT